VQVLFATYLPQQQLSVVLRRFVAAVKQDERQKAWVA
jgi:hypothetical protein